MSRTELEAIVKSYASEVRAHAEEKIASLRKDLGLPGSAQGLYLDIEPYKGKYRLMWAVSLLGPEEITKEDLDRDALISRLDDLIAEHLPCSS